jgi:hypothetical protein
LPFLKNSIEDPQAQRLLAVFYLFCCELPVLTVDTNLHLNEFGNLSLHFSKKVQAEFWMHGKSPSKKYCWLGNKSTSTSFNGRNISQLNQARQVAVLQ